MVISCLGTNIPNAVRTGSTGFRRWPSENLDLSLMGDAGFALLRTETVERGLNSSDW